MRLHVGARRMFGMFGRVRVVAVREMRVVGGGFVIAVGMVPGGFAVVAGSVLVMFRCVGVMFGCFVGHGCS